MSTTDQQILTDIQYTLVELPDGGATFPSGLWTQAEVLAAMNERQNRFLKSTLLLLGLAAPIPLAAGDHRVALPQDWLTTVTLTWRSADGERRRELPRFDSFQADHGLVTWQHQRGTPQGYMDYDTPNLLVQVLPAPDVDGFLDLLYVPQGAPLDATGEQFTVPDEFVHAVGKYGTLADLFAKDGRGKNAQKASYCELRYHLAEEMAGIILRASWV